MYMCEACTHLFVFGMYDTNSYFTPDIYVNCSDVLRGFLSCPQMNHHLRVYLLHTYIYIYIYIETYKYIRKIISALSVLQFLLSYLWKFNMLLNMVIVTGPRIGKNIANL